MTLGGAGIGALIGSVVPIVGTGIGAEGAAGAFRWHEFITRPAWDPNEPGFPQDLGVRVQRICVVR